MNEEKTYDTLDDWTVKGEAFVLTKYGRPTAEITPILNGGINMHLMSHSLMFNLTEHQAKGLTMFLYEEFVVKPSKETVEQVMTDLCASDEPHDCSAYVRQVVNGLIVCAGCKMVIKGTTIELPFDFPPKEEARRDDSGKERFDLVPEVSLIELVKVFTFGAKKYEPRNWEKGMAFSRIIGSMKRHLSAWWMGENIDKESGLHHMAHVAFGAFAAIFYQTYGKGEDDREGVKHRETK